MSDRLTVYRNELGRVMLYFGPAAHLSEENQARQLSPAELDEYWDSDYTDEEYAEADNQLAQTGGNG